MIGNWLNANSLVLRQRFAIIYDTKACMGFNDEIYSADVLSTNIYLKRVSAMVAKFWLRFEKFYEKIFNSDATININNCHLWEMNVLWMLKS